MAGYFFCSSKTLVLYFFKYILIAGVPYTAEVEQLVRIVKAQDGDEGKNGSLTYTIKSSTFYRPGKTKSKSYLLWIDVW